MRSCVCLSAVIAALLCAVPVLAQDAKKPDPPKINFPGVQDKKDDPAKKVGDPAKEDKQDPKKVGDPTKDDKKDPKKKDDDSGKDDKKAKLNIGAAIAGRITKMDADSVGEMTVQITHKVKTPHGDAAQRQYNYNVAVANYQKALIDRQNDLAQRMFNIQREKNPINRQNQIIDYQKVLNSPPPQVPKLPELFYLKDVTQDVVVRLGKELVVRNGFPEPQYDDKGNLIPLTPKVLKDLAGPEGYPGFPAQLSDLRTGQTVQLYLARPKTPTDKKKQPGVGDIIGKSDGGGPDELVNNNAPEVLMVVIVKEGG